MNSGEDKKIYRTIVKATGLFGGTQVFTILCSIIKTKLVAIWLGAEGVGIIGLYSNTVDMISALTRLGIGTSSVRDLSRAFKSGDRNRFASLVKVVRRWVWFTGLLGAVLMLTFAPVLSRYTFGDSQHIWGFVFLSCTLLFTALTEGERAIIQASNRLRVLARCSVLGSVLALLLILSHRIVRPMAESYEKQKQFITDAGHELKTPMTIIGADVDLAEMECGENQWLSDIRRQAQRLTGLTNDLIYLSRMEEEQPRLQWIEFPLSDMAEEMAQSFQALARSQEKELIPSIQPMLSCCGDEKSLRQLLSILLDNALKYSPSGGRLELRLERQGRRIQLTVSNTTSEPVEPEKLPHLFDRFYRSDQSRNSQTGGYGLGLSIARSIVLAHKGKIRAESRDGQSLSVVVSLPI